MTRPDVFDPTDLHANTQRGTATNLPGYWPDCQEMCNSLLTGEMFFFFFLPSSHSM